MSSFKRKATGKQTLPSYPGTRISPASNLSLITSTGVASLDDILGGGLPLSCALVFAAPDMHSSYGELVQKYFIAQGLASGHRICVVGQDAGGFVGDAMWLSKSQMSAWNAPESDDDGDRADQKVKIAWRYGKMKQFQTTVGNTSQDGESFCLPFELSSRIPKSVIDEALDNKMLSFMESLSTSHVLGEISKELESDRTLPLRICIPALGSAAWGDLTPQRILYFLHSLRSLLRKHSHGCASITLAPQISTIGTGWMDKVGWVTDGAVTMSGFTGNPALCSIFPGHHGLVEIHRLPAPHTLSPPSDRLSMLRGLGRSGENNLAFKCTRKRLVFETLHLDVEGGQGERRIPVATTESKAKKRVVFENDF